MYIVNIIGGLGNQMFCYAFALSIKHHYGADVALHIGGFEDVKDNQGFELSKIFDIDERIINDFSTISHLTNYSTKLIDKIKRKIFGPKKSHFQEVVHRYDPEVLRLKRRKDIYLEGLWQDEKYFKDIEDTIRNKLQFIQPLDPLNKDLSDQMNTSNSVSIHVRRGDYVSNPMYAKILGDICTLEYYELALNKLKETESDLSLFIFSDDIEWVKNEFLFLKNEKSVTYINHNKGTDSYKDMQLMSKCKHNIIANSTFSWWGAWLNDNPEKKVLAPKKWFNNPHLANNHIVPDEWIKIENGWSK